MSIKKKALALTIKLLKIGIQFIGKDKSTLIMAQISEDMIPIFSQKTDHGFINFFCPGKMPEWRARTLLIKEPETIEWIDNFNVNDIFWDIGANVGVFTLYAALRGLKVLSFEPSPSNYYLLSKNVEINKMDDRVFSYCIAFNDLTKLDFFLMSDTELGGSYNSFGVALDLHGKEGKVVMAQAMIGYSIDDFIAQFNPQFPNYIKIDVDGIEDKIIEGAKKTLRDNRLKSVLIELNKEIDGYKNVIEIIESSGMKIKKTIKRHPDYQLYNYIFERQ
jgi:FkbM family methyltransferase